MDQDGLRRRQACEQRRLNSRTMTGQQAGKKTYISAVPKDTAMSVCEVRTAFTAKFVVAAPQRARGWWVHLILRD